MNISFIGNIGKDAQLRKVQNGDRQDSVCSFQVAENIHKRDGSTKTLWHQVTIWRGYAETMVQYLKKGRKVFVEGTVTPKSYVNQNTNAIISYLDVQADKITLLDSKPEEEVPPVVEPTAEDAPAEAPIDDPTAGVFGAW